MKLIYIIIFAMFMIGCIFNNNTSSDLSNPVTISTESSTDPLVVSSSSRETSSEKKLSSESTSLGSLSSEEIFRYSSSLIDNTPIVIDTIFHISYNGTIDNFMNGHLFEVATTRLELDTIVKFIGLDIIHFPKFDFNNYNVLFYLSMADYGVEILNARTIEILDSTVTVEIIKPQTSYTVMIPWSEHVKIMLVNKSISTVVIKDNNGQIEVPMVATMTEWRTTSVKPNILHEIDTEHTHPDYHYFTSMVITNVTKLNSLDSLHELYSWSDDNNLISTLNIYKSSFSHGSIALYRFDDEYKVDVSLDSIYWRHDSLFVSVTSGCQNVCPIDKSYNLISFWVDSTVKKFHIRHNGSLIPFDMNINQ